MNVKYLTSIPESLTIKKKKNQIRDILDEFMKTDYPCMAVPLGEYKNLESARASFNQAVRALRYPLRVAVPEEKNAVYVIKVLQDETK